MVTVFEQAAQFEEYSSIMQRLREIGVRPRSIAALAGTADRLEKALPVLVASLDSALPESVAYEICLTIQTPLARDYWSSLKQAYLAARTAEQQNCIANVLGHIATREHLADLEQFLGNESLGGSRVPFLRPAHRIANRMERGAGTRLVEDARRDPHLATEAMAILKSTAAKVR